MLRSHVLTRRIRTGEMLLWPSRLDYSLGASEYRELCDEYEHAFPLLLTDESGKKRLSIFHWLSIIKSASEKEDL